MFFLDNELKDLTEEKVIGNSYPYNTKDKDEIERYIHSLVRTFNCSESVNCFGIFNHYWSGYASFVDIFCYVKDGKNVEQLDTKGNIKIKGLSIYVSRLAPVAIIGEDIRFFSVQEPMDINDAAGHGFLQPHEVLDSPSSFMEEEFIELTKKLHEAGYTLLGQEVLSQNLNFQVNYYRTFLKNEGEPYRIFDAIFYWCD